MGKFNNLKLLELGTSIASVDIVKYAKSEGAYVIVADYLSTDKSEAKEIADEAVMISTLDIDNLVKLVIDRDINAVFCGVSEQNIKAVIDVTKRTDLACYASDEQWSIIQNKERFKIECEKYGIRVPKSFTEGDEVEFPVIVKPAEGSGSVGISICNDINELLEACKLASSSSRNNKYIIEEYIVADDIMVFFDAHNGIIDYSAICDRIMWTNGDAQLKIPVGYLYPSVYLDRIDGNEIKKIIELIRGMKIRDGLIGFQCFFKNNQIIPYDPTFRLDGTMSYYVTEQENGINAMKMLVDYSINGTMGNDEVISSHENPKFHHKYFQLSILLTRGTIGEIYGVECIEKIPEILKLAILKHKGDVMKYESHFTQIGARIIIEASSRSRLKEIIGTVFETLKFCDINGSDMVINRNFDYDRYLIKWIQ